MASAPARLTQLSTETEAHMSSVKLVDELVRASPDLAKIVGTQAQTRVQMTKALWKYIADNDLQSLADPRRINPDPLLAAVLGDDRPLDMYEMTDLVAKHVIAAGDQPTAPVGRPIRPPQTPVTQAVPAQTERPATVKTRIGQQSFREAVLALWDGQCALSGLEVPELLRASHIKPWQTSSDSERLDPFNGLLLAPNLDRAFDCGFITFADDGLLVVSPQLPSSAARALGLSATERLRKVPEQSKPFLAYHRRYVFRRTSP